jgi:hypothetical protein
MVAFTGGHGLLRGSAMVLWKFCGTMLFLVLFSSPVSSRPPTDDRLFLSGLVHGRWETSHVPDIVLPLMACGLIRA